MKHIFKKHHTPDLDWSTLETSEEDSTQLINAIADGGLSMVYQPETDTQTQESHEDELEMSDSMELLSVPVQPHLLRETS